ncbi:unnamed protein product [Adineta ricciae]|uniref:Uncharacterized protein n=1 Tax=Adineta ricciae TaxID=249248 RepID=A0A814DRN0_ADIRI|nr:unnamed protein product [Adineta ricciae]CAF1010881.1 unnamed protein product [Adineta ricciae]
MSDGSRPTSRWSSARLTTMTTVRSNAPSSPLFATRKKLQRSARNTQSTFTDMTKSKNDIEEIFKFYYSNETKIDTFKQTVTGTRIVSPRQPPPTPAPAPIHNPFVENSSGVFKVKHCVSREDMSLFDRHGNEYQLAMNELNQLPLSPILQDDVDDGPMIIQSMKLHSQIPTAEPTPSIPSVITPKTGSLTRHDEFPLVKIATYSQENSNFSFEQKNLKRTKTAYGQRPKSLATPLSIPVTPYALANSRRDQINFSPSSTSTSNSAHDRHVLTGTAMTAHQRPPTRSVRPPQRTRSNLSSQQSNVKTSPFLAGTDVLEAHVPIVTQPVASIPSKCSRYVLITFPKLRTRYNIPTSVERLLLPERFPVLFQNILQNSDHDQNHK